jgi:hypothetical protein
MYDMKQTDLQQQNKGISEKKSWYPSSFKVEIATEKLRRYKSPDNEQIPAKQIKAGGNTLHSEIHKCINSIWNKEQLPQQWKESITALTYTKGDKIDSSNYRGISLLPAIYTILTNIVVSRLTLYADEIIGIISVDINITDQLLIRYWRKNGSKMGQYVSYL